MTSSSELVRIMVVSSTLISSIRNASIPSGCLTHTCDVITAGETSTWGELNFPGGPDAKTGNGKSRKVTAFAGKAPVYREDSILPSLKSVLPQLNGPSERYILGSDQFYTMTFTLRWWISVKNRCPQRWFSVASFPVAWHLVSQAHFWERENLGDQKNQKIYGNSEKCRVPGNRNHSTLIFRCIIINQRHITLAETLSMVFIKNRLSLLITKNMIQKVTLQGRLLFVSPGNFSVKL